MPCASVFFGYLFRGSHSEPSPLGKGDRSGARFGEARAKKREAIAVDEVHHTDALSRLIRASALALNEQNLLRKPAALFGLFGADLFKIGRAEALQRGTGVNDLE